jgi:predicted glycosyltransferase
VNRLIIDFIQQTTGLAMPRRVWTRSLSRRKRALYLSSPIGPGHARRDVAVAIELRRLRPDIEIDWLAQHPVTAVLEAEGEHIHAGSLWLANESAHMALEARAHDLHCFQALRRMDEILVVNFMVFQEVVDEGLYAVVIGDEAGDVDHFWHENPELKRGQHVWLTDFVGFLAMPDGGEHEAYLTADYNAEMIEHVARFPWIRDRAIFVGNPDDLVTDRFGTELPFIRDWTEQHVSFSGYIAGFTPPTAEEIPAWRSELGYRDDELVCVVAVGGSGVGRALLDKVIAAYPLAKQKLPAADGRRGRAANQPGGFPHSSRPRGARLHRAALPASVRLRPGRGAGGLTTTMELTAAKRPFLYFPLGHHFEQNFHVRHRLQRYGAGQRMEYVTTDPDLLVTAITETIARPVTYRDVESDGSARAALLIAELI